MIGRRCFSVWLGSGMLGAMSPSWAQQAKAAPRLGVLDWSSASDRVIYDGLIEALREIGYAEGQNIIIDYRGADGDPQRLARFAAELVSSRVDLVVAIASPAAHAAKKATQTIPVVFHMADPVASGLVGNLARPGGNLTGISLALPDIAAKWLELVREIIPGVTRVAFLGSKQDPNSPTQLRQVETGAARLGITVQPFLLNDASELEAAFASAADSRTGVAIVQTILLAHRKAIAALAASPALDR